MVTFTTTILKFDKQGEKTGWTYVLIPAAIAQQIKPGTKKSFRVKGKLDKHRIEGVSLLPMGEGDFVIPINAALRKAIGKRKGDTLTLSLQADDKEQTIPDWFLICMEDDKEALSFFTSLPMSHQRYFIKWIESAKTETTRDKRIIQAIVAFGRKQGYGEMIRFAKENKTDGF